jgi:hypothetical protein
MDRNIPGVAPFAQQRQIKGRSGDLAMAKILMLYYISYSRGEAMVAAAAETASKRAA